MKSLPSVILLALMVFACTENTEAFWFGPSRSSDVTIINKSNKDFILTGSSCHYGGFSADRFPEHEHPKGATKIYRIQSNGYLTGVDCKVKYLAKEGAWFEIQVDNPYMGRNKIKETHCWSLKISHILGQGNHNKVRFVIQNSTQATRRQRIKV